MRFPGRLAVAVWVALFALGAAAFTAGCATRRPIAVTWDEREDLSRFRTWDWIDGEAVYVRTPSGNEAEVRAQLSALIASNLRERGLERAPGNAAIRVAVLLVVHRTYHAYLRTRAMQTLHSHHDTGNYEIEGQELERRPLDRIRLSVYVTGAQQERVLWQAVFDDKYLGGFGRHLDDAIGSLLAEFPPRSRATEAN